MIANRKTLKQEKLNDNNWLQSITTNVRKQQRLKLNSSKKINQKDVKYMTNRKNKENENSINDDSMNVSNFDEKINFSRQRFQISSIFSSFSSNQMHFETTNVFRIKLNKSEKQVKLISIKTFKMFDFIRNLLKDERLQIEKIFRLFFIVKMKQLLNKSNIIREKLTLSMQRSISRYRVKKSNKNKKRQSNVVVIINAMIDHQNSSIIITQTYEDDEQSQSLMITAWIKTIKFSKIFVNENFVLKLINRRKLLNLKSFSFVKSDEHLWINLIIDVVFILTNYIYLSINVAEVETVIKTWIVDNQIYDLLFEISWMRRIIFNANYDIEQITINENDEISRQISVEIFSLQMKLFTMKLKKNNEKIDVANATCQIILN